MKNIITFLKNVFLNKEIYIMISLYILTNIMTSLFCQWNLYQHYSFSIESFFNPIIFIAPFLKLFFLLTWDKEIIYIFYSRFSLILNVCFLFIFNMAIIYILYKYIRYRTYKYFFIFLFLMIIWCMIAYSLYSIIHTLSGV